jgi:hypothetical protein
LAISLLKKRICTVHTWFWTTLMMFVVDTLVYSEKTAGNGGQVGAKTSRVPTVNQAASYRASSCSSILHAFNRLVQAPSSGKVVCLDKVSITRLFVNTSTYTPLRTLLYIHTSAHTPLHTQLYVHTSTYTPLHTHLLVNTSTRTPLRTLLRTQIPKHTSEYSASLSSF